MERGGLHQVQQEQERRPVGPQQVVKDEQDGTARGHPLDPRVQRLEQPKAVGDERQHQALIVRVIL